MTEAVAAHQGLADKSVEIDLLGDDAVVAEVLAATIRPTDWGAAKARWAALYGTVPPDELVAFLDAGAAALRARVQASPTLQGTWTAQALERVAGDVDEIAAVLRDPRVAVRLAGDRLRTDLSFAVEVASELGAQIAGGHLAGLVDLRFAITGGDRTVIMQPRPGVDLTVTLTKRAPDTPEGRAEIERLQAAVLSGMGFEADGVDFRMEAGGLIIVEELGGRVEASAPVHEVDLTVGVRSPGLPEQRVMARVRVTQVGDVAELLQVGRQGAVVISGSVDAVSRGLTLKADHQRRQRHESAEATGLRAPRAKARGGWPV